MCKAEYRPGFTECSDCGVGLVGSYAEARRQPLPLAATTPEKYGTLLWRGTDPHFYLGLLSSLASQGVASLGRPTQPAAPNGSSNSSEGSSITPEFDVWVAQDKTEFARWILASGQEDYDREKEEDDSGETTELDTAPGTVGICPLCFAEFPTASDYCPNCGVPLRLAQRGSLEENPSRELCNIGHPKFAAELRAELKQAGIPFNNANYVGSDFIIGRYYVRSNQILVLNSDLERATKLMAHVLQHWELEPLAGFGVGHEPFQSYWPVRAEENKWLPEDLSAVAWQGGSLDVLSSLGMALREHEIAYQIDASQPGTAKVLIHPEDEQQATEIVREILQGGLRA